MHREVFSINKRGEWHVIEALHEHVVNVDIISRYSFFSERKVFGHVSRFMVSTQQNEIRRIVYLPYIKFNILPSLRVTTE